MLLTTVWFQPSAPIRALGCFGSVLARIRSIRSAIVASAAKPPPGETELVSKLAGLAYISSCLIAYLSNHRVKQMWKP